MRKYLGKQKMFSFSVRQSVAQINLCKDNALDGSILTHTNSLLTTIFASTQF